MASDTPFEIFLDPPQASSTNSSNTVATPILNGLPLPGLPENTRFCNGCYVSRPWRDFLKGNGPSHDPVRIIDNNTTNAGGETRFFKQCTKCRSKNKRSDKANADRRRKSDEAKYGSQNTYEWDRFLEMVENGFDPESLAMLINSSIERGIRYEITGFLSSLPPNIAPDDKEAMAEYIVNHYEGPNGFSFHRHDTYTISK
jgi:hypothetical protein